jgi:hypothetical protein
MPYVIRNSQGLIIGASIEPTEDSIEYLPWGHHEVVAFAEREKQGGQGDIGATDFNMARVTEDLIDLLVSKNIIRLDELPEPAQKKLQMRKSLRSGS